MANQQTALIDLEPLYPDFSLPPCSIPSAPPEVPTLDAFDIGTLKLEEAVEFCQLVSTFLNSEVESSAPIPEKKVCNSPSSAPPTFNLFMPPPFPSPYGSIVVNNCYYEAKEKSASATVENKKSEKKKQDSESYTVTQQLASGGVVALVVGVVTKLVAHDYNRATQYKEIDQLYVKFACMKRNTTWKHSHRVNQFITCLECWSEIREHLWDDIIDSIKTKIFGGLGTAGIGVGAILGSSIPIFGGFIFATWSVTNYIWKSTVYAPSSVKRLAKYSKDFVQHNGSKACVE